MSANCKMMENNDKETDNNSDVDDDDDDNDGLQIVLESPNQTKRKPKLELNENDKQVIACVEKDLEETLEQKAEKANLTAHHVKNILKHVVTNEHVVALVRQVENSEKTNQPVIVYEPKFTRAKTKELLSKTDNTVWQTPQSKLKSETQLLISDELQEDSSGDEYVPEIPITSKIQKSTKNNVGKPILKKDDDANIALRTRSKYNLSHQKLEEIEGSFIPPDITTDMYDMDCDDDEWCEFLKTFTKPLDEVVKLQEDEEQDPEYNILADEDEIDEVDTEELRADRAVTISKKEVNNLMAELFEFVDFYQDKKEKCHTKDNNDNNNNNNDNNNSNEEKIQEETKDIIIEEIYVDEFEENEESTIIRYHLEILAQQIRQHVQLATQNFLLTYEHPELGYMAAKFKKCLEEFKEHSNGNLQSYFYAANLHGALELVEAWENFFKTNSIDVINMKDEVKRTLERVKIGQKNNSNYRPIFPTIFLDTVLNSNVFIYPNLLPKIPFNPTFKISQHKFLESENHLIALFLEQMIPILKQDPHHINKMKTVTIRHVCHYLRNLLMPNLTWEQIERQIRKMRYLENDNNPIRYYFQNKRSPPFIHTLLPFDSNQMLTPAQLQPDKLPYVWKRYLTTKTQKKRSKNTQVVLVTQLLPNGNENTQELLVDLPKNPLEKKQHKKKRLCDRNFNILEEMLPDMPSLSNTPIKQKIIRTEEIDGHGADKTKEQETATIVPQQSKPGPTSEIRTNFQDIELSSNQIIFSNLNPSEKDNPADIHELMIASSTVKNVRKEPSGAEKKRAKIRREFLANLAMATPETPENKTENDANFAIAYHEKLKETLSDDEYNDILKVLCDFEQHHTEFTEFYNKIQSILLPKYEELSDEFLLFLTTYQANKVGKLMSHLLMKDMANFMKKVSIYYKDQPLQMRKFLKCLNDLCHPTNEMTIETIKNTILPLFKGNEILTELFLQVFPNEKPSKLLINGPYEVVDLKTEMSRQPDEEICETIVVPDTEDPYGGANCICDCHNVDNQQFKLRSNHCNRCGLKFIQGKPYIQTGKGLRPAVVSFLTNPEKDHTKRLMAVQRKRSDSSPNKHNSPNKEQNHDENRNSNESEDEVDGNKKKRKRKVKRNCKSVIKNQKQIKDTTTKAKLKESKTKTVKKPLQQKRVVNNKKSSSTTEHKLGSNPGQLKRLTDEQLLECCEQHEHSGESTSEFFESSQDITNTDSDNGSESSGIIQKQKDSWSREEDKIILQTFQQRKGNEETFQHIVQLLGGNRSIIEIKNRFKKLMLLLQEMAPKSV